MIVFALLCILLEAHTLTSYFQGLRSLCLVHEQLEMAICRQVRLFQTIEAGRWQKHARKPVQDPLHLNLKEAENSSLETSLHLRKLSLS